MCQKKENNVEGLVKFSIFIVVAWGTVVQSDVFDFSFDCDCCVYCYDYYSNCCFVGLKNNKCNSMCHPLLFSVIVYF